MLPKGNPVLTVSLSKGRGLWYLNVINNAIYLVSDLTYL